MDVNEGPRVFALCGLDGVGKTSLFRALAERCSSPDYAFVGRGPNQAEATVERLFPRRWNDYRDWLQGNFAGAMALACALDYAAYHEVTIASLLRGTSAKLFGRDPLAIVTDRHALCFQAYARCIDPPSLPSLELLAGVPQPDVIFFVEISEGEAERRRQGEAQLFEDPRAQAAERRGYQEALEDFEGELVRVDNSGPFEETLEFVQAEMEKRIRSPKG